MTPGLPVLVVHFLVDLQGAEVKLQRLLIQPQEEINVADVAQRASLERPLAYLAANAQHLLISFQRLLIIPHPAVNVADVAERLVLAHPVASLLIEVQGVLRILERLWVIVSIQVDERNAAKGV